jgi:catechol 2,3-dioxygenase-like lactoylglutathione lyase family enzyme
MLNDSDVSTRLPAQDLARARAFYAQKLGLEPVETMTGGRRLQRIGRACCRDDLAFGGHATSSTWVVVLMAGDVDHVAVWRANEEPL